MEPEFWRERWSEGRIGFHRHEAHPMLERFGDRFAPGARILVPLCGKSLDMHWLVESGYSVVGVELVESAVAAFFEEAGWTPEIDRSGPHPVYRANGVELHAASMLDITPKQLGEVTGVYDRASTIALPPEMRAGFAAHMASLLPARTEMLMVTVTYDRNEMSGPPFCVPPSEVEAIFGGPFEITNLAEDDALDDGMRARGLSALTEHALWLRRRG